MAMREFHYRWEYELESWPQQLWPLISDTNRFNRDTGVPEIATVAAAGKSLRNARRRLRLSAFGIPVEWEELAKHGHTVANLSPEVEFVPGGRARLLGLSEKLVADGVTADLIALLVDFIENADDLALARIRPYELAAQWKQPRREVLEA